MKKILLGLVAALALSSVPAFAGEDKPAAEGEKPAKKAKKAKKEKKEGEKPAEAAPAK